MFLDSLFLFLFGIGINFSSQKIFNSISNLNSENKTKATVSIKPIITFVGILFFCSFINFLLIIPSLLEIIIKNNQFKILVTEYTISLSEFTFLIISVIGIFKLIQIIWIYFRSKTLPIQKDIYFVFCLLISFLFYFSVSPKSFDIHYDTGAYHLPFVLHLSSFGIERGLSHLNFGYAFYHLNFFGQVPIQNLSNLNNYISPSLNILFFGLYTWFFLSEYLSAKKVVLANKYIDIRDKLPFLVKIYFFVSLVFYPENIFNSLSSYSAALPQFICGSIVLYIILFFYKFSNIKYSFISIFFLTFYSPILKGTGLLLSAYLACMFLFVGLIYYKKKENNFNISFLKDFFIGIFNKYIKDEKTFFFIIFSYLTAFLTNIIMSGYPLYPYKFFGPIGRHAFPLIEMGIPKFIISWHRFSFNNHVFPEKYTFFDWLPQYLFNGTDGITIILLWIIPTLLAILIQFAKIFNKKYIVNKNYFPELIPYYLLNFSISFFVLQIIIIFFLIPVSVYIPWIAGVSIFVFFLSSFDFLNSFNINIQKSLKILSYFFISIFFIVITSFSIKNKMILTNLPNNFFKTPFLPDIKKTEIIVNPKRWETPYRIDDDKVRVRIPIMGDQCWSTPPPCIRKEYVIDKL